MKKKSLKKKKQKQKHGKIQPTQTKIAQLVIMKTDFRHTIKLSTPVKFTSLHLSCPFEVSFTVQ